MADLRRTLVPFLLLSVVVVVVAAAARDAPLDEEKTLLPGAFDPGAITACWSSLLSIPSCSREAFTSFLTFRFQVGPECCKSMDKIGRNCFEKIPYNPFLPFTTFNPFIGVKYVCMNPSPPAPPAA